MTKLSVGIVALTAVALVVGLVALSSSSAQGTAGDASCDGTANSIDSTLILQASARIIASVPCPANANVNGDSSINSLDAVLILQFDARLIDVLESAKSVPTSTPTRTQPPSHTATPTPTPTNTPPPASTSTPTATATFTPAAPQVVELCSYYSAARQDFFTTTSCGGAPPPDYVGPVTEGMVFGPGGGQPAGTVPLFLWYSNEREDNFTSSDPIWDVGSTHPGYDYVRIEGYVYSSSGGGRCQLRSYYNPAVAARDNYATTRPSSVPGGYGYYRVEGYTASPCGKPPTTQLCSYHSVQRLDFFTTTTCGTAPLPDYTGPVDEGDVFDPTEPAPAGTVPLLLWYNNVREDNFTTSDPIWGVGSTHPGYDYVRIEGYIYSDAGPGRCPLRSYYNPAPAALDNYLTTRPSSAPAGYTEYRIEGYAPSPCP